MRRKLMIGAALGALIAFTPVPAHADPSDCSSYQNPTVRDGCRIAKQQPCEQDPTCFTPPSGAGPGWYGP
jgi:hypothetical protein